jgi:Icc-related predicted phosphoesterase
MILKLVMKKLSICIISDTHSKHKHLGKLPEADIIIHCGDMTSVGRSHEIVNFMAWFSKLDQYKHKICIAGNHDWLFETNKLIALEKIPENVIYLEDESVAIEGMKFYGTPVQKHFCNWAFNRSETKLAQHWAAIPDDTDVLITHSPPYGILDLVPRNKSCEGSPSLYMEVMNRIRPKIHCYGHIHESYGIKEMDGITFINASNLDGDYMCVNDPVIIEI